MEVLGVVPARAGSKGLPGKNLRTVGGRSLVARAVDAGRAAALVTRIVGSTDDEAIADEMRRAGAEVPSLRPSALAGDDVPDPPVFLHVLDILDAAEHYRPDIVVNIRPTAPLRTGADIDGAVRTLIATPTARSVKAVSEAAEHPYKMWTIGAGSILQPLLPNWLEQHDGNPDVPRQHLPTVYRSSGAVDAVWVSALRETGMFHPGPVVGYVLDASRDVDIDTVDDLRRAEELADGGFHG